MTVSGWWEAEVYGTHKEQEADNAAAFAQLGRQAGILVELRTSREPAVKRTKTLLAKHLQTIAARPATLTARGEREEKSE